MACCEPCENPVRTGCGFGIECTCVPCVRPVVATLELNIVYNCRCNLFTNNCTGNPFGTYCIQCCDKQLAYDEFYNGTHILEKVTGTPLIVPTFNRCDSVSPNTCDDFFYRAVLEYPPQTNIPSWMANYPTPFIIIEAFSHKINIAFQPVEYYPCAGTNVVWCGSPTQQIETYCRNRSAGCDETSFTYNVPSHGTCLYLPQTLTLELVV